MGRSQYRLDPDGRAIRNQGLDTTSKNVGSDLSVVLMSGEIFISYRRDDSAGTTGRIYDRILRAFPREKVFMDVDAAMHGLDFVRVLNEKIAASDLVAVVIGPNWLTAIDATGRRRIDNPQDFVRIEVGAALRREIPVIPVLIDGATMPGEADLPPDLEALARRHAVELRNTRFADDADTLVDVLTQRLGATQERRWLGQVGILAVACSAIVAAILFWRPLTTAFPNIGSAFLPVSQGVEEQATATRTASQEDVQADADRKARSSEEARKDKDVREKLAALEAEKERQARELRERIARLEGEARARAVAEAEERRRQELAAEERVRAAAGARARAEAEEAERQRRVAEARARAEAEEAERQRQAAEERARAEAEEAERQRQAAAAQAVAPTTSTPAVDIASLPICERLWHQRNSIFHSFGYCFSTGKGLLVFGNANCFRNQDQTWLAMGEDNRQLVNRIKEQERANACKT